MRNLVAGLALIAIIALGVWWYTATQQNTANQTPSTQQNNQTSTPSATESPEIVFDGNSFSPRTIEVTSGSKIVIRNNSSRTVDFTSDPHPIHTNNSELNIGSIAPGGSREATLTRKGTWGYHDHNSEQFTGTIVVR
jgi:cytoskeletal protein RodZ